MMKRQLLATLCLIFSTWTAGAQGPPDVERELRRALALEEKRSGPDHPEVGVILQHLALLLMETDRPAEAEPLLRRVITIDEKFYGPDHPEVARDLTNLGAFLQTTHRLAGAEPVLRRALAIDEKVYGPNHPDVAGDLNNLGAFLVVADRLVEAEPVLRRALTILLELKRRTGHDHPGLQAARANYAALLEKMGKALPKR